jgi:hypothetical protein
MIDEPFFVLAEGAASTAEIDASSTKFGAIHPIGIAYARGSDRLDICSVVSEGACQRISVTRSNGHVDFLCVRRSTVWRLPTAPAPIRRDMPRHTGNSPLVSRNGSSRRWIQPVDATVTHRRGLGNRSSAAKFLSIPIHCAATRRLTHAEASTRPASGPQSPAGSRAGVTHPHGSGLAFAAATSGFASRLT